MTWESQQVELDDWETLKMGKCKSTKLTTGDNEIEKERMRYRKMD